MSGFQIHSIESAPEGSKATLEAAKAQMGMVPNLFGVFADSPATLNAYAQLGQIFEKESAFDATESQVVLMTTSRVNSCAYCMAAHTGISKMQGVSDAVIEGLRNGSSLGSDKLDALASFTATVVGERGWVSPESIEAFKAAGYEDRHVQEVILGVALKTISNYVNHIAETPLDKAFEKAAWQKA